MWSFLAFIITELDFWKNIAAVLGVIAAALVSLGVIHQKAISPWIAKPVAKALQRELEDQVELILFGDKMMEQLKEVVQEQVVEGNTVVVEMLKEHETRLDSIEHNQRKLLVTVQRGNNAAAKRRSQNRAGDK